MSNNNKKNGEQTSTHHLRTHFMCKHLKYKPKSSKNAKVRVNALLCFHVYSYTTSISYHAFWYVSIIYLIIISNVFYVFYKSNNLAQRLSSYS